MINIKRIETSLEELENIIPESYYTWLIMQKNEIKDLCLFGAFEGEKVKAIALYAGFRAFLHAYSLIYIETEEYSRRRGIAKMLLKETLGILCEGGDRVIAANIFKSQGAEAVGLIEQAGFESMEDSTMLFYEVSSVKNSLLAQRLEELSPMLKAVKKTDDIENDAVLRSYGNYLNQDPIGARLGMVDRENTYYFQKDNEILGHGFFTKPQEDVLVLLHYQAKHVKPAKHAIPFILSAAIKDNVIAEDETTLIIYVDDKLVDAVKSILGEPEESEPMFYYLYNSGSNRV